MASAKSARWKRQQQYSADLQTAKSPEPVIQPVQGIGMCVGICFTRGALRAR